MEKKVTGQAMCSQVSFMKIQFEFIYFIRYMTEYALYRINKVPKKDGSFEITEVDIAKVFSGDSSYRKAHKKREVKVVGQIYTDTKFEVDPSQVTDSKGKALSNRRIYELYDTDVSIFDEKHFKDSYIQYEPNYPSFVSEFSMIDKQYLRTIFFNTTVTKKGYFQYFVRRNGQYYVESMDDIIPVQSIHQTPAWGLTINEPWKLLLMKAWIKEKNGIKGVIDAKPYEFIEAFGMPGYRALSLKKEIESINASRMGEASKMDKEKKIPINIPGFITVGKTRDNPKVNEFGLQRNRAGYRIIPVDPAKSKSFISHIDIKTHSNIMEATENIYKVKSSLLTHWNGQYSIVDKNAKLSKQYKHSTHQMNLEREFLATFKEISEVFSKFYISPEYTSKFEGGNLLQDSIIVQNDPKVRPFHMFGLEVKTKNFLNLNITLPSVSSVNKKEEEGQKKNSTPKTRYATIKYFIARDNSEGKDFKEDLCKYLCYDIEQVKGYHHSCNRFLDIEPGKYFIYVKIDSRNSEPVNQFAININTNAHISSFGKIPGVTDAQMNDIVKSILYGHGMLHGFRTEIHKNKKDLAVYLGNFFDSIGFGYIIIKASKDFQTQLAMTGYKALLGQNALEFAPETEEGKSPKTQITVSVKPGSQKIFVFEKNSRKNNQNQLFPPEGAVDFFDIA